MLLNREHGENDKEWIHLEREQTEATTMCKSRSQVDNSVPIYTKIESMGPAQVTRTTGELINKEIPTIVEDSCTTFWNEPMRRQAQELVMSLITSFSKTFSTCCSEK